MFASQQGLVHSWKLQNIKHQKLVCSLAPVWRVNLLWFCMTQHYLSSKVKAKYMVLGSDLYTKMVAWNWYLGLLLCFLPCGCSALHSKWILTGNMQSPVRNLLVPWRLLFSGKVCLPFYTKGSMWENATSEGLTLHFSQDAKYFR